MTETKFAPSNDKRTRDQLIAVIFLDCFSMAQSEEELMLRDRLGINGHLMGGAGK